MVFWGQTSPDLLPLFKFRCTFTLRIRSVVTLPRETLSLCNAISIYINFDVCVCVCGCVNVAQAAKELLPCCLLCQFAGKITFLLIVADAWALNIKSNSKRSGSNYSSDYLKQQQLRQQLEKREHLH